MSNLIPSQTLTMSSLEIAHLLRKNHSDIKRSAERLVSSGVINNGQPLAEREFTTTRGNTYTEYLLVKRDCFVLVAQNSPEFTAAIVDRWQELEAQQPAFQVPQTLPEALRLAADLADQVQEQQKLIEHQKPAVEFVERFVESKSAKSLREVAKVLGVKERDFIARLIDEKILYRQSGNLLPYAQYQHRNIFTVKTGTSNGHAYHQTRFTPEGINWISKRFGLISGGEAV